MRITLKRANNILTKMGAMVPKSYPDRHPVPLLGDVFRHFQEAQETVLKQIDHHINMVTCMGRLRMLIAQANADSVNLLLTERAMLEKLIKCYTEFVEMPVAFDKTTVLETATAMINAKSDYQVTTSHTFPLIPVESNQKFQQKVKELTRQLLDINERLAEKNYQGEVILTDDMVTTLTHAGLI